MSKNFFWPEYGASKSNVVFQVAGSFVEKDDWRSDQLKFWGRIFGMLKT
jgi:cholinesterase